MTISPSQLVEVFENYPEDDLLLDPAKLHPMRDATREAFDLDGDDEIAFFEESAALFLRRVFEIYKRVDVFAGHAVGATVYQAHWLQRCLQTAAGARFAREFPIENRQLSHLILDQISSLPDGVFTDDAAQNNILPFTSLLAYTIGNPRLIGPQLPIQLSRATLMGLQQRLPFIQHLIQDRPFPLAPHPLNCLTALSKIILHGNESDITLKEGRGDESFIVWRSCELLRDRDDRAVKEGMVRCDEGIEMMACGRCPAVRYCCGEHQKAHWKRHKLFCLKPAW